MQLAQVVQLYETGRRGRPIRLIQPGDLRDPYGKSPWQRLKSMLATIVETAREVRELEARMRASGRYPRAFRQD